jgi:hypothetical protein
MKQRVTRILLAGALALVAFVPNALAQGRVDIGLYRAGGNLEVRVRPEADFDGIFSSLVFTIRWDRSTGATLGDMVQEDPARQYIPILRSGNVRESGSTNYQVYAGFGMSAMASHSARWRAGEEVVIATIPVTGKADFELVNDAFTNEAANNANYYVALGGADRTGVIFKSMTTADEDNGVLIRPNPNNGQFTFSFTVAGPTDLTVDVLNSLGQSVYTESRTGFEGNFRKEMDLTAMSTGAYYLRIKRGEQITTHKVVYK